MNIRYMGKRQTPLEIYPRTPLGTLRCHQRPCWPNSVLILYLLNYTLQRHGVKGKPPLKFTIEHPWVHYSATKGPGGQIRN